MLEGQRGGEATQPQTKWFLFAAIALLLGEIAVRRLWAGFSPRSPNTQEDAIPAPVSLPKEKGREKKKSAKKEGVEKSNETESGLDAILKKAKAEAKKHDR